MGSVSLTSIASQYVEKARQDLVQSGSTGKYLLSRVVSLGGMIATSLASALDVVVALGATLAAVVTVGQNKRVLNFAVARLEATERHVGALTIEFFLKALRPQAKINKFKATCTHEAYTAIVRTLYKNDLTSKSKWNFMVCARIGIAVGAIFTSAISIFVVGYSALTAVVALIPFKNLDELNSKTVFLFRLATPLTSILQGVLMVVNSRKTVAAVEQLQKKQPPPSGSGAETDQLLQGEEPEGETRASRKLDAIFEAEGTQ